MSDEIKGYIEGINLSLCEVPGYIAYAIYFQGCPFKCKGCHNEELWVQKKESETSINDIVKYLENKEMADYIVFIGGEPLQQINFVMEVINKLKYKYKFALYTGYNKIPKKYIKILDYLEFVKYGRYIEEKRVYGKMLATTNQKIFIKNNEYIWNELEW